MHAHFNDIYISFNYVYTMCIYYVYGQCVFRMCSMLIEVMEYTNLWDFSVSLCLQSIPYVWRTLRLRKGVNHFRIMIKKKEIFWIEKHLWPIWPFDYGRGVDFALCSFKSGPNMANLGWPNTLQEKNKTHRLSECQSVYSRMWLLCVECLCITTACHFASMLDFHYHCYTFGL